MRPFNGVDRLCWIAAAALVVVHGALLWRFVVDWPLQDDLVQILAVPGYLVQFDGKAKLAHLFALNPDQRVVTHRLIGWIGASLPGGLDFRLLTALGNALGLAAGLLILRAYPSESRAPAALLAALLLASMTHWSAQYWASAAIHHLGTACFALGALFVLAHARVDVLAAPLAFAAAFTSANGLVVFPAAVVLCGLQGRRRAAILWGLAGAVIAALYFHGHSGQSGPRSMALILSQPVQLTSLGLASLGGIGETFAVSVGLGAAVALGWCWLAASGRWRRVSPFVLAAAVFLALSCAMIAAGRAALGPEAVILSRYRVYSALLVLLTLAAIAATTSTTRARWMLAVGSASAAGLYAAAFALNMPHVVYLAMTQKALRDHFAAAGHGQYLGFPQEFGDFTLRRARDVGAYHGVLKASPPASFVERTLPSSTVSEKSYAAHYRDGSTLSIAGWTERNHETMRLWLANERLVFSAPLFAAPMAGGALTGVRTGFHGTANLGGIPAGQYRVGYGSSGVHWLEARVDVR